jgi:hypothetical protein
VKFEELLVTSAEDAINSHSMEVHNIGYGMTMQARHTCDEEKVKSIKMVSIRPSDVWHLNDTTAGIILEQLNYLMPSQKYLLATDTSKSFDSP